MSNRFAAFDVEEEEAAHTKGGDKKATQKKAPAAAPAPAKPAGEEAREKEDGGKARRPGAPRHEGVRRRDKFDSAPGKGRPYDHHLSRTKPSGAAGKGDAAADLKGDAEVVADAEGAADAAAEPEVELDDGLLTLDDIEKARAEKRQGALFSVAKEDTSKLMDQFKGIKKVEKKDDDDLQLLGGKMHSGAKKAEEAAPVAKAAVDVSSLLAFKVGHAEPPRRERTERSERPREPRGDRPERAERGERPERGERAPRGGPRGGRGGRGAARGGARPAREGGAPSKGPRVDVSDEGAFPALGH